MAILEPRRATAELPVLVQRGVDEPIVSYPSLDRTVTTVTPEAATAPLIRDPGTSTAVPRMISEAVPIPGISSGANIPKSMIRTGTADQSSLNPLVGAGLGALIGNIISKQNQQKQQTTTTTKPPPTGTGGGTPRPGSGTPGGSQQGGVRPVPGGFTIPGGTGAIYGGRPVTNTAQPGEPGHGWQYFTDGTAISPNGEYYYQGEPVWSPHPSGEFYWEGRAPVDVGDLAETDPGYGWQYFQDGTAISPEGDYYYQGELVYSPGGSDASLTEPYQDQQDSGENIVEYYDPTNQYVSDQYYYSDANDFYGGGPDYSSQYNFADLFDYSNNYGYDGGSYEDYAGWGGSGDDYWYGKKGGMATPLMREGGGVKMADGGDAAYELDNMYTLGDYAYDPLSYGVTSSDADIQEGGFYGNTSNTYTDPVSGEVYQDGVKIYDPNVGIEGLGTRFVDTAKTYLTGAGGALKAVQDLATQYPGTTGAIMGALLSQALGQPTGGGRVNLGVDMSQFGQISPRTTTFGVGAPRFMTYEQYGTPERMPEMYGEELYRNLNVPGFNPVNPQMSAGGLASMAQGGGTYYTFGKPVNPAENLMGMKDGGAPVAETGDVPVISGRKDYREGAAVNGPGDGQSDDIPAMLADGEYVIDAETVAMLGNGSNKAGAKKLDEFRENIRAHKRDTPLDKIPKPAKSPLAYLKGSK